METGAAMILSR